MNGRTRHGVEEGRECRKKRREGRRELKEKGRTHEVVEEGSNNYEKDGRLQKEG